MKTNNKTKHFCKIATLVLTLLLCINFAPTALAKAGSATTDNTVSLSKAKAAKKNAVKLKGTKGKNKAEVAALKKILKHHNRENSPFLNLDSKCYTWDKDGRLTRIGGGDVITKNNSFSYEGNLSLSAFPKLTQLYCGFGKIKKLDVSKNTALVELQCPNNQLTSLDVSNCPSLTGLNCSDNQLTSLDVSNCTSLLGLTCSNNQLTSLDVSDCTPLISLLCDRNRLSKLNVSKNTALRDLNCNGNRLSSLNLSKNTSLGMLTCMENKIAKLDVSNCKSLYMCIADNNVKVIGYNDPYQYYH